jgi:hypothetical protein
MEVFRNARPDLDDTLDLDASRPVSGTIILPGSLTTPRHVSCTGQQRWRPALSSSRRCRRRRPHRDPRARVRSRPVGPRRRTQPRATAPTTVASSSTSAHEGSPHRPGSPTGVGAPHHGGEYTRAAAAHGLRHRSVTRRGRDRWAHARGGMAAGARPASPSMPPAVEIVTADGPALPPAPIRIPTSSGGPWRRRTSASSPLPVPAVPGRRAFGGALFMLATRRPAQPGPDA